MKYSDLKCLPKKKFFTKIPIGGIFSSEAKKYGHQHFGVLMEKIMELSLRDREISSVDVLAIFEISTNKMEEWENLFKLYRSHFEQNPLHEPEWTCGPIQGHPDFYLGDIVYEMKTTGRFNAMRSSTIMQILSYYCLAQKMEKPVTKIGLILPMQMQILIVDLSSWDWKPFWETLVEKSKCIASDLSQNGKSSSMEDEYSRMILTASIRQYVGYTVRKPDLYKYLGGTDKPIQFFVSGNRKVDIPQNFDKKRLRTAIGDRKDVFIHSPYPLNLSNPDRNGKKEGESFEGPWVVAKTKNFLKFGDECGISGIIIHVGRIAKSNKKRAYENMKDAVKFLGRHASVNCPLLIETPAGERGELLSTPEEFIEFIKMFKKPEYDGIGVCVDSCHVFASGFRPGEYLKKLEEAGIKIDLIHYNDSKWEFGAKKDRHARPLEGCLTVEDLADTLAFAIKNNIPCVRE
jgi:endonuclease IV